MEVAYIVSFIHIMKSNVVTAGHISAWQTSITAHTTVIIDGWICISRKVIQGG